VVAPCVALLLVVVIARAAFTVAGHSFTRVGGWVFLQRETR
jgi:hypothetical protein